jgi:hypothetical protein
MGVLSFRLGGLRGGGLIGYRWTRGCFGLHHLDVGEGESFELFQSCLRSGWRCGRGMPEGSRGDAGIRMVQVGGGGDWSLGVSGVTEADRSLAGFPCRAPAEWNGASAIEWDGWVLCYGEFVAWLPGNGGEKSQSLAGKLGRLVVPW